MISTIEISIYPFHQDYKARIQSFAARLRSYPGLRASTGPTSTVVVGEHSEVMACLTELLAWSHREQGRSAFVVKFVLDYNPDE